MMSSGCKVDERDMTNQGGSMKKLSAATRFLGQLSLVYLMFKCMSSKLRCFGESNCDESWLRDGGIDGVSLAKHLHKNNM